MNRRERRKAKSVKHMKIVAGDIEMNFTPATVERICKEYEAENPGKIADVDMTPAEFADRMMKAITDGARPLPIGTA